MAKKILEQYVDKFLEFPPFLIATNYNDPIYKRLMKKAIKIGVKITMDDLDEAFKDIPFDLVHEDKQKDLIDEFQELYKTRREKEDVLSRMSNEGIDRLIETSSNIYGKIFYSKFKKKKENAMEKFFVLGKGQITSVICGNWQRDLLVKGIVEEENYRTMVWSKSSCLFVPCSMVTLTYGCNLIEMFQEYEKYFDTLIVDCLCDDFDVENVKKFLQWIKVDEKAKQKSILIFFKQKSEIYEAARGQELETFVNLKEEILRFSDNLYAFIKDGDVPYRKYWLKNLNTNEVKELIQEDGPVSGYLKFFQIKE